MSSRILLVEDDPSVAMTLRDLLRATGYEVERASEGISGLDKAVNGRFDLVILDVMLPGKNGFEICGQLRKQGSSIAILMLTARIELSDRIAGLDLGADDYLIKPFEPPELLSRVGALLRRVGKGELAPLLEFRFGDIEIDFQAGEVRKNGLPVSLATKELELLRHLIERRGRVVSREELLEAVWRYNAGVSTRTLDVHVAWLRQKLETSPQNPKHIHTVRGVGYKFVP